MFGSRRRLPGGEPRRNAALVALAVLAVLLHAGMLRGLATLGDDAMRPAPAQGSLQVRLLQGGAAPGGETGGETGGAAAAHEVDAAAGAAAEAALAVPAARAATEHAPAHAAEPARLAKSPPAAPEAAAAPADATASAPDAGQRAAEPAALNPASEPAALAQGGAAVGLEATPAPSATTGMEPMAAAALATAGPNAWPGAVPSGIPRVGPGAAPGTGPGASSGAGPGADGPASAPRLPAVPLADATPVARATPAAADRELPVYRTLIPPAITLRFQMRRGALQGTGELQWRPAGDRYEARLEGRLAGITLLTQTSLGGFDEAGLAPDRFTDQRLRGGVRAANFQREAGKISFSGPTVEYPLLIGSQDRLSWMIQLAAIVSAEPQRLQDGGKVVIHVVGARGDARVWVFRFAGREPVATAAGPVAADKFSREPADLYDTRVDVWLDPQRHHLPVRAALRAGPDDDGLELLLQEAVAAP